MSVPVPLGLQSGCITSGDISASSNKYGHEAKEARLHGQSCWMPANDDTTQYFTVAFHSLGKVRVNLTAIATQGAPYNPCWITTYSLDIYHKSTWNKYKEGGIIKVRRYVLLSTFYCNRVPKGFRAPGFQPILKCYCDQIIDIHFFTFSCTIWLSYISCQISIHYEH